MGVILGIKKPKRILEIGMAVGFSASFMVGMLPEDGKLVTIDRYPLMIEKAKANFERLGVRDKIELIEGDANEVLSKLDGEFDFVFMDAGKGQYINILEDVIRLTKVGGVIMTDDIFQSGQVALPPEEIPHRNRTIYNRLNKFMEAITTDKRLRTSLLTIGDGVALMEKLED
jgi:predicted O-methyltransferase YrrM